MECKSFDKIQYMDSTRPTPEFITEKALSSLAGNERAIYQSIKKLDIFVE